MWIRLGGRWRQLPARRSAVWRALVELLRIQVEGAGVHGPPPPLAAFRYRAEGRATRGPRRGSPDDRWLPWWELPKMGGYLIGDCEDLSTAYGARLVLVDGEAVVPVVERPEPGFHALTGILDPEAGPLPPQYYAGPALTEGVRVVDPSYLRGMRDPRRSPACERRAREEGLCQ